MGTVSPTTTNQEGRPIAARTPTGTAGVGARTRPRSASRRLTTETKDAFLTTEFWAYVVVLVGLLIAGLIVDESFFNAQEVWLYATILTVGYMISRGLAKAGNAEPYWAGGSNADPERGPDPDRR